MKTKVGKGEKRREKGGDEMRDWYNASER